MSRLNFATSLTPVVSLPMTWQLAQGIAIALHAIKYSKIGIPWWTALRAVLTSRCIQASNSTNTRGPPKSSPSRSRLRVLLLAMHVERFSIPGMSMPSSAETARSILVLVWLSVSQLELLSRCRTALRQSLLGKSPIPGALKGMRCWVHRKSEYVLLAKLSPSKSGGSSSKVP